MLLLPTGIVRAQNVIPDASFEEGSGWELGDYASSIDDTKSRLDTQSLKLINDASATNHNAGQYRITGIQPGAEYEYSVWVSGTDVTGLESGSKPLAVMRWRTGGGALLEPTKGEMYMWAPFGTYDWRKMSINVQAPATAAQVDILFRSWEECLTGFTHWDDVSLAPRDLSYRGSLLGSYQAEDAAIKVGGIVDNTETKFTGSGYFQATDDNAYVEWTTVSGGATGGSRILSFRYAWEGNAKNIEVLVNGVSLGTRTPPATGRVNSWASSDWQATLQPGLNRVRLRVSQVTAGPNIDKLDVYQRAGAGIGSQEPFGGTPWAVPGTIQAEDYDAGGEGVSYHDSSAGNNGGQYRDDDVDIWLAMNSPEGYYTGANTAGEWLEYTIDVAGAGQYRFDLRVTTPNSGGQLQLALDGVDLAGVIAIPNTGSWENWQTVSAVADLTAGQHVLRAQFVAGGFNLNWIEAVALTYDNTAAAPTITPDGGDFDGSVEVNLATATPGAAIHYTVDGSTPDAGSPVYTGPFTLTADATVQALAAAPGFNDSDVVIADFVVTAAFPVASTPTITPDGGDFDGSVAVSLATATPGAAIHYTVDGSPPDAGSPVYAGPFTLTADATVQAIATAAGYTTSAVASADFTVTDGLPTAAAPTITPDGGEFSGSVAVSLATATPGAAIHYTVDGSPPDTGSPAYTGPFTLTTDTSVQAMAAAPGHADSAVVIADFTITGSPAPSGGGGGGGCFIQSLR